MNKLETKEAVEILLSEKKKAEANLAKVYDGYCLLPNEHDQEDWDNYSALVTALEMAVEALEKQIPKKPIDKGWLYCPICEKDILLEGYKFCPNCGQKICWEGE